MFSLHSGQEPLGALKKKLLIIGDFSFTSRKSNKPEPFHQSFLLPVKSMLTCQSFWQVVVYSDRIKSGVIMKFWTISTSHPAFPTAVGTRYLSVRRKTLEYGGGPAYPVGEPICCVTHRRELGLGQTHGFTALPKAGNQE